MKVLNITEEGRGGGPLNRIRNVASELDSKGINTTVLFPKNDSEKFRKSLERDGVKYKQLQLHRLTKAKKPLLLYLLTFFAEILSIKKVIKEESIDVLHANGSWQVKGIIAARLAGIKSVWHMNDSYQSGPVRLLFKVFGHWADGFIYASAKTMNYYQNINPKLTSKKGLLIQAPVDTIKFKPGDKNGLLEGDGLKLISVGYVNANKGFETLLRSIIEINENTDLQIDVFIVGTIFDSQKAYFKKLTDIIDENQITNVHFLGYRSDVKDLLHSADIFVCSSDFEASPIAVWEALASGIPVVSTNVGDVKEIFEANKCGLVTECQDHKGLAKAIVQMANDKSLQQTCKSNGRKVAEEYFSLDSVVKKHESIYKMTYST